MMIDKIKTLVQDASGKLASTDYDQMLDAALKRYSKHRPDEKVADIAGNGTHDYDLPAGWADEFSAPVRIEYPIGSMPEELLDADEYYLYKTPAGKKLRVVSIAPAATASFRVTFTIPRTDLTVPDNDVDAVAMLAASLCLEILATRYVDTSDPTIAADVVNYRSKSSEAAGRAKTYLKLYKEHLGIKEDDTVPAASAVSSHELNYPGGGDRLTHPRRLRRLR
jgi:hypothetical protein